MLNFDDGNSKNNPYAKEEYNSYCLTAGSSRNLFIIFTVAEIKLLSKGVVISPI